MGFPKIRGTILRDPITRIIVCWVLYWGSSILGTCHIGIHRASCHRFEQICWKMGIGKKGLQRHTTELGLMAFLG